MILCQYAGMIRLYATINGINVLVMTENNSIPNTQEVPSKASLSTLSLKTTRNPRPPEEIQWRDGTILTTLVEGKRFEKKKRKYGGHPSESEYKAGHEPGKYYDLIFVEKGNRKPRTFDVQFVSLSNTDKEFTAKLTSSSFKGLLRQIPWLVAKMRCTNVALDEFIIRFKRTSTDEKYAEHYFDIPLLLDRPPELKHTNPDIGTLTLED